MRFFTVSLYCLGALILFTFANCFNFLTHENENPWSIKDGSAGSVTHELNDMGDVGMDFFGGSLENYNSRDLFQDTVVIDIEIVPWRFDSISQGWVFAASGTIGSGTVSRHDTIWFYNANNEPIQVPSLALVSHYNHVRSVQGTYQNNFHYRLDINVNILKEVQDTFFVFNGKITGECNGSQFAETIIIDVKRKLRRGLLGAWLSFPLSGTIDMDRPLKTVHITFGGQQTAKVIVTRKSDGKTWIFLVNIKNGQELS